MLPVIMGGVSELVKHLADVKSQPPRVTAADA
jgi:hypothetical protein